MRRAVFQTGLVLCGLGCIVPGALRAGLEGSPRTQQTEDFRDPATAIQFNLSNPGARSLAMGGAFLGLADDATAAYTNPAGLTNLALGGSEVTVEVRQSGFTTAFANTGHIQTNVDFEPTITLFGQDTVSGLQLAEAKSETSGLSFLSFGYVLPRGLTLALYRHELANYQGGFESQGPFLSLIHVVDDSAEEFLSRIFPQRSSLGVEIVNYGVSGAFEFDLPSIRGLESVLSVGLGVSYYELEFERRRELFDYCRFVGFDPNRAGLSSESLGSRFPNLLPCANFIAADDAQTSSEQRLPGGFFGPADFSPDNSLEVLQESAEDSAVGINLGFLWKLGRLHRWSIGAVFRQGPDFETTLSRTETQEVAAVDCVFEDANHPVAPVCIREVSFPDFARGTVTVPDVFGLGVAYRSTDGMTKIALDVNRVRYSQSNVDFARNSLNSVPPPSGFFRTPGAALEDFATDDADELHLGLERTFLVVESLWVGTARFGLWNEPYHGPRYTGDEDELTAYLDREASEEIHISGGFGLVIKEDYQIDIAVDVSDPVTVVSFSLVKFF